MIFTVVQKRLRAFLNHFFHKKRCSLGGVLSREKTSLENPQIFQTCKIKIFFR